ncbi:MAG: hypothetical protein GWN14_07820 [candidate division Zixibacteria bacterium]|nr:hypothetical protein [Gammaproteobacteria bacterium]NIX55823.1 hypothetical protein [candidate division Zixibacteria bacterium]
MSNNLKHYLITLILLMGGSLFLEACKLNSTEAIDATATNRIAVPTPSVQNIVSGPVAENDVVDQCLTCHTDKQMLIDTAKPEEEEVSENEGAG